MYGFRNFNFEGVICKILQDSLENCVKLVDNKNFYPTKQPKYVVNNCRVRSRRREDNRRVIAR